MKTFEMRRALSFGLVGIGLLVLPLAAQAQILTFQTTVTAQHLSDYPGAVDAGYIVAGDQYDVIFTLDASITARQLTITGYEYPTGGVFSAMRSAEINARPTNLGTFNPGVLTVAPSSYVEIYSINATRSAVSFALAFVDKPTAAIWYEDLIDAEVKMAMASMEGIQTTFEIPSTAVSLLQPLSDYLPLSSAAPGSGGFGFFYNDPVYYFEYSATVNGAATPYHIPAPVPEPGAIGVAVAGLLGLFATRSRWRKHNG